ncbi:MAG: VWA domain-containing protein [Bacteriovoracaceae bacterium]|nr:VWA domain-containing protein [Bacteriovoracaceae bacterium]
MKYILSLSFFILFSVNAQDVAPSWGNCLDGDVWFLTDISGSLEGQEPKIKSAIKLISERILASNPNAMVGLLLFNTVINTKVELTNNVEELGIDFTAIGGTDIFRALGDAVAYDQLKGRTGVNKIIILISDGYDYFRDNPSILLGKAQTYKDLGYKIISIHFSDGLSAESFSNTANLMSKISGEYASDQSFYYPVNLEGLAELFIRSFSCL